LNSFKNTRTGITLVYIGLVLTILSIFTIPLATVLRQVPVLFLFPLLLMAASLLSMIGRIFCLSVPKEVGASGLIYSAVALDVGSLFAAVSRMIGLPNFSSFSGLLSVAAMVFFLIFLKKLAVFIKDNESADRVANLLWVSVGLVIVLVGMIFLPRGPLAAILAFMSFALFLVGFFIYNRLLSGLRKSLGTVEAPTGSVIVEK
jgi:hypothetical protein